MISVNKRKEAPTSLSKRMSYTGQDVIDALKEDAYSKCYICETDHPIGVNVEHFEEHGEIPEKKYGWHNLFYACEHCNHTKNDVFRSGNSNLINCADPNICPDLWIEQRIMFLGNKSNAEIKPSRNAPSIYSQCIANTVKLLRAVYNGTNGTIRSEESFNLMNQVTKELFEFMKLCLKYTQTQDQTEKDSLHYIIELSIRDDACYAGFKRWVVRDYNIDI